MEKIKQELNKVINALMLEVNASIADDVYARVSKMIDKAYKCGKDDAMKTVTEGLHSKKDHPECYDKSILDSFLSAVYEGPDESHDY